jgi:hypothetical protein
VKEKNSILNFTNKSYQWLLKKEIIITWRLEFARVSTRLAFPAVSWACCVGHGEPENDDERYLRRKRKMWHPSRLFKAQL